MDHYLVPEAVCDGILAASEVINNAALKAYSDTCVRKSLLRPTFKGLITCKQILRSLRCNIFIKNRHLRRERGVSKIGQKRNQTVTKPSRDLWSKYDP